MTHSCSRISCYGAAGELLKPVSRVRWGFGWSREVKEYDGVGLKMSYIQPFDHISRTQKNFCGSQHFVLCFPISVAHSLSLHCGNPARSFYGTPWAARFAQSNISSRVPRPGSLLSYRVGKWIRDVCTDHTGSGVQDEFRRRLNLEMPELVSVAGCASSNAGDRCGTDLPDDRIWEIRNGDAVNAKTERHGLSAETQSDCPIVVSFGERVQRTWIHQILFVLLGLFVSLFAASGFRPSFAPSAQAATAEIFIKARPKRTSYQKASFEERAIYGLDYFFATEPGGKAIILMTICASMTGIGGILYYRAAQTEGQKTKLSESMWSAWTFISDPGTHAGEEGLHRRMVAVPLTMGGMLFFALLVGLMSDAVSARVDHLQKGASLVIEENHTIIIGEDLLEDMAQEVLLETPQGSAVNHHLVHLAGWTPKTIPLVRELTVANKRRGHKRSVVVLGDRQKEDMDKDLREALPLSDRNGSKVVTRTGVPTETEDLRMCSAAMARSIILLSPPGVPPYEADALVLHTALVLAYLSELKADIVVELAELENVQVLKEVLSTLMNYTTKPLPLTLKSSALISTDPTMIPHTGERLQKMVPVATGDIVMRMMVERALQPEIAAVAGELLRFDGSEFRFRRWPELAGKTFGEIVYLFDNAIPCGMRKHQPTSQGIFTLVNPPVDTVFEEGDRLLVISEDEDSYKPGKSNAPKDSSMYMSVQKHSKPVLKILICGWRHDVKDVLRLIDCSVAKGSEVTILTSIGGEIRAKEIKRCCQLQQLKIIHKCGDPLSRQVLERLPLEQYHKAIILADQGKGASSHSATTTAMFIRHIQVQRGKRDAVIVAELPATHEDALQQVQGTWLNDSVQPEQLQAMVLAHLAEDADVGGVLDEVVSDYGSSMLLRDIGAYAKPGERFNFWELQARALQHGELVIAHKCAVNGNDWVLNPPKKAQILSWSAGDEVLVLTRPSKRL